MLPRQILPALSRRAMSVTLVGYRHLIEPPVTGDCQDIDCVTLAATDDPTAAAEIEALLASGRGVLLVASYKLDDQAEAGWVSVCAPCDGRRLRAWLEDES